MGEFAGGFVELIQPETGSKPEGACAVQVNNPNSIVSQAVGVLGVVQKADGSSVDRIETGQAFARRTKPNAAGFIHRRAKDPIGGDARIGLSGIVTIQRKFILRGAVFIKSATPGSNPQHSFAVLVK